MNIEIDIPDDIRLALEPNRDALSGPIREAVAIQGYRRGLLSLAQVRRLLDLATRWDAQVFLGSHGVNVFDLDASDLDREAKLQVKAAHSPQPE